MKRTLKRFFSILMAAAVIITAMPFMGLQLKASAGTNGYTAEQAVKWAYDRRGTKVGTGECVDLINYYYNYLGYSAPYSGVYCGKDFATAESPLSVTGYSWKKIPYYDGFVAQKGDIAIWTWNSWAGNYGHVAIVDDANSSGMTYYDQGKFYGYVVNHRTTYLSYHDSNWAFWGVIRPDFSNAQSGSSQGATGATSKVYVGNNIAYFSWNEDPNAEYYHVRIWKKENGTEVTGQYDVWNFSEGLSTSVVLPNGQYRAYIHACGPNYSSKKEDLNFTVVKESPMITVSSYRLTTTLSWPTVSGATHYEVNIYKDKLWATGKLAVQEGNLTSTSYTTTLPVGNYQSYINYFDSSGKLIQQTAAECFYVQENVYAFTENNVVYISWIEDPLADLYNVRIKKIENGEWLPDDYSLWSVTGSSAYTTLPPGDYVIYVDAFEENQTVQSNFQFFTVTLKDPILSSTVSDGKVFLSWTSYPNVHHYSLTIFKDRIWVGSAVFDSNQVYGQSIELDLPEGTYQAYVNPLDSNNNRLLAYSGSVETFTINHSHQYTSIIKKEATCSEDGLKESTCSSCGNVYTETIPALGHNYQGTVTASTCSSKGFTTYKCSRCGDTYISDYTDTIPHQSATWHTSINPTATSDGLAEKKCDYCGKVLDSFVIPHLVPDYVTGITLSQDRAVLKNSETVTITAEISPETAKNKMVKWTSLDTNVATVNDGIVTAKHPGSTVIIAETTDGGYKDFCLVKVVGIIPVLNSTAFVDYDNGIISGIEPMICGLDSFVNVTESGLTLSYSTAIIGTGTTVNVCNNGEVVDAYTTVIFGDVNGDGIYDGTDAMIVKCIANGMLTKEQVGEAVYMAADCNHDGVIDRLDVDILNKAGVLFAEVDQSKGKEELIETSSAYNDYLNIIDQSVKTDMNEKSLCFAEEIICFIFRQLDIIINYLKQLFIII